MERIKQMLCDKFPNLSFHEAAANFLVGQWPRASMHDPEIYIRSLARVFSNYSDAVVVAAIDPVSGVASVSERVPTVKTLTDFVISRAARIEQAEHYKQLQKTPRREYVPDRPIIGPNLFVPVGAPKYDAMFEMAQKHPKQCRAENGRLCSDDERRDGIWIPDRWYHPDNIRNVRRVAASATV